MSNKLILVLIIVLVMILTLVGLGFFVLWGKVTGNESDVEQEAAAVVEEEADLIEDIGPIFTLKTMIVNLADPGGNRYLRITMDLEIINEESRPEVQKRLPQIKDSLLMILPAKQFEEVSTVKGKNTLREEIIDELNSFFQDTVIINIYFTEFVVQ